MPDPADPTDPTDRAYAEALDHDDPVAPFRHRVRRSDQNLIYLDGNSLGMLPLATQRRLGEVIETEWGDDLVRGWHRWVTLPGEVGDRLGAAMIGAGPGQTLVCDNLTVNLYKLARAALRDRPGALVVDDDNFPTDRYVLAGVAEETGRELRVVHADPVDGVTSEALADALAPGDVALVSLSHVAYRSGALLDLPAVTAQVHAAGALVLWDLAHSMGAVPVELDTADADLAVGCTYKYGNAGPGAPGFLYVNGRLVDQLRSPIQGWWAQADEHAIADPFTPARGIARFHTGTPSVPGLIAVDEGVRLLSEAGIRRLRDNSIGLTSYLVELADQWLSEFGLVVASPRDAHRRGGHVVLRHPDAYRMSLALIDRNVVPDYRTPDLLRLGPAPLTTSFVDVHEAMRRLRDLVATGEHEKVDVQPGMGSAGGTVT